jgi:hypothetical protein
VVWILNVFWSARTFAGGTGHAKKGVRRQGNKFSAEHLLHVGGKKEVMAKKKREHSRVKVSFPATIASGGRTIEGKIENISLTGALIHCKELPNLSKRVRLTVELSGHSYVMSVHARIIRLDIHDAGDGVPAYDLGMTFVDLSEEDIKFLSKKVLH